MVAGTGSNDTAHSVHLTRAATERGADAVLVVTPYYNKPNRRGLKAHFEAVAAATDMPMLVYNIPARCVINLEPDLLAELAEVDEHRGREAGQRRHGRRRGRSSRTRASPCMRETTTSCARSPRSGAPVASCVSSHLVGERMKEMYEAARSPATTSARARSTTSSQDVYETLFFTASPAPVKAALNLLGFEAGGVPAPARRPDRGRAAAA